MSPLCCTTVLLLCQLAETMDNCEGRVQRHGHPTVPFGMLMVGTGFRRAPSNCGSHCFSASSISMTMSRVSFKVSTAPVSGSSATAASSISHPQRAASAARDCTVMLLWFSAARCGRQVPDHQGVQPSPSAYTGTSTQES